LKNVKERFKKVYSMIKEYNKKLEQFPGDDKPAPLPTEIHLNETLLADSTLWGLDQYSCTDKWARDRSMQHIFKPLSILARAKEEVVILLAQCRRHVNYHITDLQKVQIALATVTEQCEVRRRLLNRAQASADNLRQWKDMQGILDVIRKYGTCEEEMLIALEGLLCFSNSYPNDKEQLQRRVPQRISGRDPARGLVAPNLVQRWALMKLI
jgi:hypothetical protein